jgi:hypothetical protein
MSRSTLRRGAGFVLTSREVDELKVPREIGAAFDSGVLEIFPASFVVLALLPHGAVRIARTGWLRDPPWAT